MGRWLLALMIIAYAAAITWRASPTSPPESTSATPQADIQPIALQVAHEATPWPAARFSAAPDLRAIDAHDEQHAVVGGALVDGDQVIHACLFRTADGGRTWAPLGPAHDGARFLAVHQAHGLLWAIGHEDERRGGALFTVRSEDNGRSWRSSAITTEPYPAHRMRQGELLFLDRDHGVLSGRFVEREGERALFVTADGGDSWSFAQARSAAADQRFDREHVATADGWSWRLRDGIIERRGPDDSWWIPTETQPMGAGPAGDLPYTAAR